MKKLLALLLCLFTGISVFSADWYVSRTTGKKKGPGTKEQPFKSIPDALKKAAAGDTIFIAEGSYTGVLGASEIIIDKPVVLKGCYSTDFSVRDVAKHPTLIQPLNEKNDTKGLSIITLKLPAGPGPDMVIDGLVIDQGLMNSYDAVQGKPEGVETGMWLEPPRKGAGDKFPSGDVYSIYSEAQGHYEGNITVQNCVIVNSGNYGINISLYKGSVRIVNNLFVACRMEACEVSCSNVRPSVQCEFAYNTVLFTWSRTNDLAEMGYGFRCMANVASNIHHNIFGLNVYAGIGNEKGDSRTKKIKLDNNVFFLNRQSDVTAVKSPNILKLMVDSEEFEDLTDLPGMESVEGNISLQDPSAFKGIINHAYLNGFLNVSYSETKHYDENSPANVFRSAMGMNKVGKITTKVSMYGNRYPYQETYKLFGAFKDYGAKKF